MKTVVFLLIVISLCLNCNRENPPSTADSKQTTDLMHGQPSPNTMTVQKQNEKNPSAVTNGKGLSVHIDPETGEFITPEEAGVSPEVKISSSAAYSTSHVELEEQPSPVPGGGTMVDLKGRFQSPLTATIDSNGNITIEHNTIESKE